METVTVWSIEFYMHVIFFLFTLFIQTVPPVSTSLQPLIQWSLVNFFYGAMDDGMIVNGRYAIMNIRILTTGNVISRSLPITRLR